MCGWVLTTRIAAICTANKQLLAVTPESSPSAAAGPKRKTAEERQWEAWATPPDAPH